MTTIKPGRPGSIRVHHDTFVQLHVAQQMTRAPHRCKYDWARTPYGSRCCIDLLLLDNGHVTARINTPSAHIQASSRKQTGMPKIVMNASTNMQDCVTIALMVDRTVDDSQLFWTIQNIIDRSLITISHKRSWMRIPLLARMRQYLWDRSEFWSWSG